MADVIAITGSIISPIISKVSKIKGYRDSQIKTISDFGLKETNPDRQPRDVLLHERPIKRLSRDSPTETGLHQAVQVGPYVHEIKKPSKQGSGTRHLQYAPNTGEDWQAARRKPNKVATTTKTDGEIVQAFGAIQATQPAYSLYSNNCQHVVHRGVYAIANPDYPINKRSPPIETAKKQHPVLSKAAKGVSDFKFIAEAAVDAFRTDPGRVGPFERLMIREQRKLDRYF